MKGDWANRLLELDASWSRRLQITSQPGFLHGLEAFLSHSGDSLFVLLALAIEWWLGNADWKSLAITLVIGVGVTALAVLLVKLAVRRPRPAGDWGQLYRKTDPHSFPSGHTARVFMLAVVTLGLGPPWLGILLAIWAPLVGLSRVILGVHYLSDVLAGALLGVVIGLGVVWLA
jgi:undecaprenyl-diphosphatase